MRYTNSVVFASFALSLIALLPFAATAQTITAPLNGDVRITADLDDLATGGGNAGDENGGFSALIVGLNSPGNVQNWSLFGFDTTPAAGLTATGAQLTIVPNANFTNGNHGSEEDLFQIHELWPGNAGWVEGGQGIANNVPNVANPGVVTFRQQAYDTTDWVDGTGAPVDNFIGAFDPAVANTNTVPGYAQGQAPAELIFEFSASDAQTWVDQGYANLALEVLDGGSGTSRFNLNQDSAILTVNTVPEPSTAGLLILATVAGAFLRRRTS